jgi:hypothetical protein
MPKRPMPKAAEKYQFKKGVSGNPLGGKKHNPIKKALSKLTVQTYREVIEMVLTGNLASLDEMIDNPKTAAIQVGVARAFRNAMNTGNYEVIERIAERIVGKIPDELKVSSQNLNANLNANLNEEILKAALAKLESEV